MFTCAGGFRVLLFFPFVLFPFSFFLHVTTVPSPHLSPPRPRYRWCCARWCRNKTRCSSVCRIPARSQSLPPPPRPPPTAMPSPVPTQPKQQQQQPKQQQQQQYPAPVYWVPTRRSAIAPQCCLVVRDRRRGSDSRTTGLARARLKCMYVWRESRERWMESCAWCCACLRVCVRVSTYWALARGFAHVPVVGYLVILCPCVRGRVQYFFKRAWAVFHDHGLQDCGSRPA